MTHLKLFTFLIGLLLSANIADAQNFGKKVHPTSVPNYTKDAKKEIKNATDVNMAIDLSNVTIMGLDSADFVSWYSKNSGDLTLKRFKNYVVKTVKENTKKKIFYPAKEGIPYLVKLDIEAISEDAGINAIFYFYKFVGGQKEGLMRNNIKIKDGRMNEFEVLLKENAEDLGKKVANLL